MGVQWTEEQRQVIELRGCNILVSAAAGSGKTAVLVERILTMLMDEENPRDIDRFLIVTFTNAAAGEMRERIRAAVEKKLEDESLSEALSEHLQRQTALLQNAQITTIHSFCQHVIRNYFHTIDLDPDFRVADEGEQKLLQNDVLKELLEEAYAAGTPEFLHMAECFATGKDDVELERLLLQLYHFSMSAPWPKEWLQGCAGAYEVRTVEELNAQPWMKKLGGWIGRTLLDVKEQIAEALALCGAPDGPYMYESAVRADAKALEAAFLAKDVREYSEAFAAWSGWERLSGKKDGRVSEALRGQVKNLRDQYKKTVDGLRADYFSESMEEMLAGMQAAAPAMRTLLATACAFVDRYAEEKREKGWMDFEDLEHFALQILVEQKDGGLTCTATAGELAAHYQEIMIDEYQDSNLVQELILNAISGMDAGEYHKFMVGDVKQSIYRFRLARPELFMEKYHTYGKTGERECRIDLHKNFRSRTQVLDCANFIFSQVMAEDLGSVAYDEDAALYPGAVFAESGQEDSFTAEVLLVETGTQEQPADETARELEARAVGERIRALVDSQQVWDKKEERYRAAQYGDIVILLRTVSGWAEVFARVLGEMGIPASAGSRTGYFSAVEIQTVLSLLKLIDNPRQDIPMTAVLYSPIVGLSGEELAQIRSRHPGTPFYQACMQEESLRGFFEMLEEFRSRAVFLPVHELLWEILEKTGYGNYAAAMPGGAKRLANLEMLVEKAIAFEAGSYHGLYHFVRYIENLHKYEVDFGEAGFADGEEHAVRILSIHKSKGLEFPIVFVAGMGKTINQMDARSALVLHADLGAGCDAADPVMRTKRQTLLKRMMRQQILQENLGEELRVLYVALTRAKEKLILAGTAGKLAEQMQAWSRSAGGKAAVLGFTARSGAKTYWDWVMPALMRNRCMDGLLEAYGINAPRLPGFYERDLACRVRVTAAQEMTREEAGRQLWQKMTRTELLGVPPEAVQDAAARAYLEEQLEYVYPYVKDGEIPAKVSVSELKKLSQAELFEESARVYEEAAPVPLIPEFLQQEHVVSGAARGTVYHKFMECLDFAYIAKHGIEAQLARLVEENQLLQEEAELIEHSKIEAFLATPLAGRMAKAQRKKKLFREQQFVIGMPAAKINDAWDGGADVLIQGIIDAYFEEDDGLVLLDYKTDFVKMQEASSLYEKYRVQLEYYENALERLTKRPVKERLIYSFCLNRVLSGQ